MGRKYLSLKHMLHCGLLTEQDPPCDADSRLADQELIGIL
jgi:hypothetical protein